MANKYKFIDLRDDAKEKKFAIYDAKEKKFFQNRDTQQHIFDSFTDFWVNVFENGEFDLDFFQIKKICPEWVFGREYFVEYVIRVKYDTKNEAKEAKFKSIGDLLYDFEYCDTDIIDRKKIIKESHKMP